MLLVFFHELKTDIKKVIRKISDFLGIEKTKEEVEEVLRLSSFDYMKEHSLKFDPRVSPDLPTGTYWKDKKAKHSFFRSVGALALLLLRHGHHSLTRDRAPLHNSRS